MANESIPDSGSENGSAPDLKTTRQKPTKSLPTDRLSRDKQFHILRALAKASLAIDRGPVSNNDVARYADVAASSVSLCNAFWVDAGLLVREGVKVRPVDAVFEYDHASEWTPETAATKLAPVLSASWFGKAMLTKLAMKPTTVNDALVFLAQECSASIEYKSQLTLILDYLQSAGLLTIEGTTVAKPARGDTPPPTPTPTPPPATPADNTGGAVPKVAPKGTKRFAIPIPDKEDAVIFLPEEMDNEDWQMVSEFLTKYVQRWKQFPKSQPTPTPAPAPTARVKLNEDTL